MQANGARLQFDKALWAHWHNVHAWVESGLLIAEPIDDDAAVTLFDSWGRVLARYGFSKGQWRHAESGAAPERR